MRIMATDLDHISWDAKVLTHATEYKDGYLILPDRPGWGTEPAEAALAKYPPLERTGMINRTQMPKLAI